jgi:hypothetical protein
MSPCQGDLVDQILLIFVASGAVPAWFLYAVRRPKAPAISTDGRRNHLEAIKTMITAAGIAIAITAAGLLQKLSFPVQLLKASVVSFAFAIVASIATLLELSRQYEVASPTVPVPRERLHVATALLWVALTTFLSGFILLTWLALRVEPLPNPPAQTGDVASRPECRSKNIDAGSVP